MVVPINSYRLRATRRPRSRAHQRGQALVEFALVSPIFFLLLFGIIEFAFLLNAQLSLNFATRDGSLLAAEGGSDDPNADCVVLRRIDEDLNVPTDENRIVRVRIFQADVAGTRTGLEQVYTRGGTTPCSSGASVPYTLTTNAFPFTARCAQLLGCGDGPVESLDIIGVQIDYRYAYVTPMAYLLGGGAAEQTISGSNSMRMEPRTL